MDETTKQENNNSQSIDENLYSDSKIVNEEATTLVEIANNEAPPQDEKVEVDPLTRLQNQLGEMSNKYLRALADMDNMKKRNEKALIDTNNFALANFAKELIVTLDIFDKAFVGLNVEEITDNNLKTFAIGMQLTQKELLKTLDKFGVVKISPLNEKFNPNFHEALFSIADPSKENGTIFEVSESGYMLKDRLLRPAKVGIIRNESN